MGHDDKRGEVLARVEAYLKRVEKLGGDTGEVSAIALTDWLMECFAASAARDTICWLIERGQHEGQSPTLWFKGDGLHNDWTEVAQEARRFPTKDDAEQEADRLFTRYKGDPKRGLTVTEHVFIAAASATRDSNTWQPIETAPKTGPAENLLLYVPTLHGTGGPVIVHWAQGGGEEQPRFGPAWFFWTGYDFSELREKPTHWMRLPHCPADWRHRADSSTKL